MMHKIRAKHLGIARIAEIAKIGKPLAHESAATMRLLFIVVEKALNIACLDLAASAKHNFLIINGL